MKIGILHLTDVHLCEKDFWLEEKIPNIASAIKTDFEDVRKIYIAITGDLADTSTKSEYGQFGILLNRLKSYLKFIYKDIDIDYVLIPGNHDCDFSLDSQLRRNTIKNIDYESIGNDNSVIDTCIVTQDNFWTFYNDLELNMPKQKLFYQITDQIEDFSVTFNCINSSWMSSIKETPGSLFFPTKLIKNIVKSDINISLIHHPLNWFSPKTIENNSLEMRKFIDDNSDIVLLAHEHIDDSYTKKDTETEKETYYRYGCALFSNNQKKIISGFKTFVIDVVEREITEIQYNWSNNLYSPQKPFKININITHRKSKEFINNKEFIDEIELIKIPLTFSNKIKPNLSEINVFPDLEPITYKKNDFDNFIDSKKLTIRNKYQLSILEGENQSGKSSLINMLFLEFIKEDCYPLIINGIDLKKIDIEPLLEKAYIAQYQGKIYEEYKQHSNDDKILLVDNLQDSKLNDKTIKLIIEKLQNRFGKIIIAVTPLYNNISLFEGEENCFLFKIMPLGHIKRNELIDNYHRLNYKYDNTLQEQFYLDKVKFSFDQVQVVLGNKLMPSYPVFILSILQSLQDSKPINNQQTSYGFCYQSLITNALLQKANVGDDLDTYINLITEFAFCLFETESDSFSEDEFLEFYKNYSQKYIVPSYNEIRSTLIQSALVIYNNDNDYRFCYDYINYYLAARKIAQILDLEEGKKILRGLCNNLHQKKQANILIFVAHHSKSQFLIEETTLSSMIPFEGITPITLEKSDPYFTLLQTIVKEFSDDIIDENRKPEEERKKALQESDVRERLNENSEEENDSTILQSKEIISLHQSLRALEIVGQIVKNGKGSISKEQLTIMIEELYNTGFRIVSYYGDLTTNVKDVLMEVILKKVDGLESKTQTEQKINQFFQARALEVCLGVFSRIIHSVGSKDLRPLYDEVSKRIGSPAAKLVTFGIKLYYSKLSTDELKKLADEFSNNHVAFEILKSNVKHYVYNNQIDYKQRQIIENKLSVHFLPAALTKKS